MLLHVKMSFAMQQVFAVPLLEHSWPGVQHGCWALHPSCNPGAQFMHCPAPSPLMPMMVPACCVSIPVCSATVTTQVLPAQLLQLPLFWQPPERTHVPW
jgi:hypothetical protein